MGLPLLFVALSFISMSFTQGRDRELYFPYYYFFAKRRLMNHTIANISAKSLDDCEYLCYMNDACVSLNIKNPVDGVHGCELNNATHIEHDTDLVPDNLYWYRSAENNCEKSGRLPCQNNATCQSGFTDKKYRCVCAPGFGGEHCEKDVDECAKDTHNCSKEGGLCVNTKGSFNCTCKPGYTGSGHNCSDIDECASPVDPCSTVAHSTCHNTNGSYSCQCNDGFIKSGAVCEADPCQNYKTLFDAQRKVTHVTESAQCDKNLNGWYRFEGAAGTQMATSCPDMKRCDTQFPGWLKDPHPIVAEGKVKRKVCFHKGDCCGDVTNIHVKNCSSYFIYELIPLANCNARYCGTD